MRQGESGHRSHCWFNFSLALFPPLQYRETLLSGLDLRGEGLGQAEFTYLSAGSLPDFTEDIGGIYRERRVKGLFQLFGIKPIEHLV